MRFARADLWGGGCPLGDPASFVGGWRELALYRQGCGIRGHS